MFPLYAILPSDWISLGAIVLLGLSIAGFALFITSDSIVENGERRRVFNRRSVLLSLWSAWIAVTFAAAATLPGSGGLGRWNYIPYGIFNFFTPILMGNLGPHKLVITLPITFGALALGDWVGKRIRWPVLRIIYNLMVLMTLTALVDVIVWGRWMSLALLRMRIPI